MAYDDSTYDDEALREEVGVFLAEAMDDHYEPVKIWFTKDNHGPMGGLSTQILAAVQDDDGTVKGVAINIYTDHNILRRIEQEMERDKRNAELRQGLGWD